MRKLTIVTYIDDYKRIIVVWGLENKIEHEDHEKTHDKTHHLRTDIHCYRCNNTFRDKDNLQTHIGSDPATAKLSPRSPCMPGLSCLKM